MIFVTVGAQMPFDRLVRCVDQWAQARGRRDVFAQVGAAAQRPSFINWVEFLNPSEFRARVEAASVVIAHAGMGSIITALELGKPILVMPRRGDLMETRNDHQLATAKRFLQQGRIAVAFDERELKHRLDRLGELHAAERIAASADPRLIATIAAFVRGDWKPALGQPDSVSAPVSVPR